MKNIKNLASIFAVLFFITLAIASSPKNGSYSDAAKWIPKDFNPKNSVLLIEEHILNAKQNEKMIQYLSEKYPYGYEIVDRKTIVTPSGKYADTKKFRFGILWNGAQSTRQRTENGGQNNGKIYTSFQWDMYGSFIDRKTTTKYPTTNKINNYGQSGYCPVINSIVKYFKDK